MATSPEDWLAIHDLFVRYTGALDNGDVETLVDCFTADGSLESPTVGAYRGRDGIRKFAERFARLHASGVQLRHAISNLAAAVDGDRAHATCYLANFVTRDGRSELLAPGYYDCDLERSSGQWRFRRRLVVLDQAARLDGV